MIFGIVGRVLDLVHEGIGLSNEFFDANELLSIFFVEETLLLRRWLLKLSVPDHRFLYKL